jgi:hypothetical protein
MAIYSVMHVVNLQNLRMCSSILLRVCVYQHYVNRAEAQTKEKSEKVAEIKRLNSRIHSIRTQMSLDEEKLDEWRRYKVFLISLTPEDWIEEEKALIRKEKHEKMQRSRMRGRTAAVGFRGRSSMVSGTKDAGSLSRIGRKSSTRLLQGERDEETMADEKDIFVDDVCTSFKISCFFHSVTVNR